MQYVLFFVVLVCCFSWKVVVAQASITVNSTDDVLNGSDGICTLREAVIAANTNTVSGAVQGECPAGGGGVDAITLPAGTYQLTLNGVGDNQGTKGDLDVLEDVTITGAGSGSTTIDGSSLATGDRVFHVRSATLSLTGVTVSGGKASDAPGLGGGVNTIASAGGGIYVQGGTLILDQSVVSNNSLIGPASEFRLGAGIMVFNGATTVSQSAISNNMAGTDQDYDIGGGLYAYQSPATLDETTIEGNVAGLAGGAAFESITAASAPAKNALVAGPLGSILGDARPALDSSGHTTSLKTAQSSMPFTLSNSTVVGNQNGGVYVYDTQGGSITNVTVSGNSGTAPNNTYLDTFAGVNVQNATVQIVSSTIAFNETKGLSVDVYNGGASTSATLLNTILSDNVSADCEATDGGSITSQGYNLSSDASCFLTHTGDQPTTDPLLQPLADNGGSTRTHLPDVGSPAFDLGSCPSLGSDQRGLTRPYDDPGFANATGGDGCDIGSVEASIMELPVELVSFDALVDGSDVLLTWATASETNNAGFDVQHLQDAAWRTLDFVDGRGTTLTPTSYSYVVERLSPGAHRFRLRQVDYDGTFEYSPEVEVDVRVQRRYQLSAPYPNPFNPNTRFAVSTARTQHVCLDVFDVRGRRVSTLHVGRLEGDRTHVFTFDGTGLPSGMYFIRLSGESFVDQRHVILTK